ncbi:MAG: SAM hydrolase/SAM-dependent halogenase family protein [Planctomycetota bacterium]
MITDFGLDDPFVGIMKGVLLGRAPDLTLVDLSHGIPPGDIRGAALALRAAIPFFPGGTVHLVVVDPGVGGPRRIVAAEAKGSRFLAPDSGIIPAALDPFFEEEGTPDRDFRSVEAPDLYLPKVSSTFHGRDIFAPVAAALATGRALSTLGPPLLDPVRFAFPRPQSTSAGIRGEVIHVDRFGNLITNLREGDLHGGDGCIRILGREVPGPYATYADVPPETLLSLLGSSGFLEIAVRNGNAAQTLSATKGTPLVLERGPRPAGSAGEVE